VLAVVALGGNALLARDEPLEAHVQRANSRRAVQHLARIAHSARLVVTHGNGPQIGLLALQAEAYRGVASYPLDVLGAESEGMIGYVIEQELSSVLPDQPIATLLTQVEVDGADPAFDSPSKPIGPMYPEAEARRIELERGWHVARDGDGYRRVVPSPEPRRIRELETIRLLVASGVLVVCAGGGGIPVVRNESGGVCGVEAVIDKDLSAALLASRLAADELLLLTDVPAVCRDWPKPARRWLRRASPRAMRELRLDRGSMGPKVEAACRYVEQTGGTARIGALSEAELVLAGESGTAIGREMDLEESGPPA
jgi:carbamate kinase